MQGGTFYNDAVLRSFEKIADCHAIRPDIAGIMGAFGAALIARERFGKDRKPPCCPSTGSTRLNTLPPWPTAGDVPNNCRLTINKFSGGRQYISGNRCERGIGKEKNKEHIPNL